MSGHGEKLSRKQEQAISGLLATPTVSEAAEAAGVGESTLRRWMKDDGFVEEYRIARRQSIAVALSNLSRIGSQAVRTLEEVMSDTEATPSSRVSAAKAALDVIVKVCEQEDLEQRISAIEAAINGEGR